MHSRNPGPCGPITPSPLVSAVQNVPRPWSSSNDFLYGWLGNSPPGARSLTFPNRPTMPLSTAPASAPRVVVSPLAAIHRNPPLTFQSSSPLSSLCSYPSSYRFALQLRPTPCATNRDAESPD